MPHAKHRHLVTDIWGIHAEELRGLEGGSGRILKGEGEFDQFGDGKVP
jgi:hypothetical protein